MNGEGEGEMAPLIEGPEPDVNATPIDPTRKTVVIAPPPESREETARRLEELQEQSASTSARLQAEIDGYSEVLTDGGDPAEASAAMADDLDAYKQQALEVYKTTRRVEAQSAPGASP